PFGVSLTSFSSSHPSSWWLSSSYPSSLPCVHSPPSMVESSSPVTGLSDQNRHLMHDAVQIERLPNVFIDLELLGLGFDITIIEGGHEDDFGIDPTLPNRFQPFEAGGAGQLLIEDDEIEVLVPE